MKTPAPTNSPLFDRFWKAYPRKEGKPKALRTFEKLKLTDETLEQVLAELERQAKLKDWKHINVKYIPLAQNMAEPPGLGGGSEWNRSEI